MEKQLEEILTSKIYVKENGALSFLSPNEYLKPFIDIVSPKAQSWEVKTSEAVVNKNTEDEVLNISYPRVVVEARLGGSIPGFESVIGLIYALNTQRPIMKIYSGQNVSACTNLTIFNSEFLFQQDLLGNYREVYSKAKDFYDHKVEEIVEFEEVYTRLNNTQLTRQQLNDKMGDMLLKSPRTRLGTTPIVQAAKMLMDSSSAYSVYKGNSFQCSEWNIFNAVTQALGSSDITERPTKTVSLAKLFLN